MKNNSSASIRRRFFFDWLPPNFLCTVPILVLPSLTGLAALQAYLQSTETSPKLPSSCSSRLPPAQQQSPRVPLPHPTEQRMAHDHNTRLSGNPGCFRTYIRAPRGKRIWLFKLTCTKSRSLAGSAPSPPCLAGCSDRQTLPLAWGVPASPQCMQPSNTRSRWNSCLRPRQGFASHLCHRCAFSSSSPFTWL